MKKALLTGTAVLALGMFGFGVSGHANSCTSGACFSIGGLPVSVATTGGTATSLNKSAVDNGNTTGSYNHSGNGNLDGNKVDNGNNTSVAASDHGAAASQGSTAGYATTRDAHDTATSGTGDAINDSTVGSYNGASASTGKGGGVAASTGGFALQLNGSADDLGPGAVLSNGDLRATNSFNHVDVDLTLADAHAGGKMGGSVTNDNQDGNPTDGYYDSHFSNHNGSTVSNNIFGSTGVITATANGNGSAQFNTSVAAVGVDNTSGLMH